jgi:L,D-transpeptidase catalytic domain
MSMATRLRRLVVAAGAGVGCFGLQIAPASAQLFWDWGGGSLVGGSGREVVHFDPRFAKGQIIVSFGDRRLYYIARPGQAISYPIAIPRDESRWQGVTTISSKRVNPSWTPTPTMVAENPRLPRWVPGGHPMNPLGVRALYLGASTYRIHGTDAPWTIGTAVSKGCIRMYNQDVLDLYPRATIGAKVTVTWQHFTTVASSGGWFGSDEAPAERPPVRHTSRDKSASSQ